jgi:hypothetical protein
MGGNLEPLGNYQMKVRQKGCLHKIHGDSKTEDIGSLVITSSFENLGSHIIRGAASLIQYVFRGHHLSKSKVDKLYLLDSILLDIQIHQYVLRFQVTVDDPCLMDVLNSLNQLHHHLLRLML